MDKHLRISSVSVSLFFSVSLSLSPSLSLFLSLYFSNYLFIYSFILVYLSIYVYLYLLGLSPNEFDRTGLEQLVRARKCPAYVLPSSQVLGRCVPTFGLVQTRDNVATTKIAALKR